MKKLEYAVLTDEQKKLFDSSVQQELKDYKKVELLCINPDTKEFSLFGIKDSIVYPLFYFKDGLLLKTLKEETVAN